MRIAVVLISTGMIAACAATDAATENLSPADMTVRPSLATTPQEPLLAGAIDVVDAATGDTKFLQDGAIERAVADSLEAQGLLVPKGWFQTAKARYNLALNIQGYRIDDGTVRFGAKYILIDAEQGKVAPVWTTTVEASSPIREGEGPSEATERALKASLEEMLKRLHKQPAAALIN
jgi:hypothetical protein